MYLRLRTRLKVIEAQVNAMMASRPPDPLETNRMLVSCLTSLGFKPAMIGLDDQGREVAGFVDPEDPPRSIPLNLPVVRFFKFVHRIQEYLTLADDPVKLAEYDPEAQRALRELGEIDPATKQSLKDFCAQCLDIHGHHRPSSAPGTGPGTTHVGPGSPPLGPGGVADAGLAGRASP